MHLDRCAFFLDGRPVSLGEVLATARTAGLLRSLEKDVAERLACAALAAEEKIDTSADETQAALDAWRTDRDLIAAVEAESWLEAHGLDLDGVVEHIERGLLRERLAARLDEALARFPASESDIDQLLPETAACEGSLAGLAEEAARRAVAVIPETRPKEPEAFAPEEERAAVLASAGFPGPAAHARALAALGISRERALVILDLEARFRGRVRELTPESALERALAERRLDLVSLELVEVEAPTEDAARELLLCVREDREGLEAVASRARIRSRRTRRLVADLRSGPLAARLSTVRAGEVLGPVAFGERWLVVEAAGRTAPTLADPEMRRRLEAGIVRRALDPDLLRRVRFPRPGRAR